MSKVFITGDTHIPIDIDKLSSKKFPDGKSLTKDDYVIILGDFGLYWQRNRVFEYWYKILQSKPWTTLWLDGNHENFDWIDSMQVSEWHGGKVHQDGSIIHLMRGQVYNINNKFYFVMGGADSHDKALRMTGIDWWDREVVSYSEIQEGIDNLEKVGSKVDYVLTHTCPFDLIYKMFGIHPDNDNKVEKALQMLINTGIEFSKWYFGHWHEDKTYGNYVSLYDRVLRIE